MIIGSWTPPGDVSKADEQFLSFDQQRDTRILILPAWFDEANALRRFTVEVMRRLDEAGFDSVLPDLPGCNESLAPLGEQTLAGWQTAAQAAAEHFAASHVLTLRAAALIAPPDLPGWRYAAVGGAKLLAAMLRARVLVAREAGLSESREALLERGRTEGLVLAGWELGADLVRDLENAEPAITPHQKQIDQSQLPGAGLWLRAEPDEDAAQADALAALIAEDLANEAAE